MYVSRVVAKACVLVAVGLLSSTAAWAIQAGIVFDVHQDIKDPDLWPNDFHVEGKLQSLVGLPTVINHLDGPFTKFKWEITPLGGEDYWFECTWWMEEPGVYIPYCEILHMGVLFDVDYKNIVIDVVSWWTRDGKPVGEKDRGALYNDGFVPMIGFNVADGSEPQLLTIANNFVTATPPPPPAEQPPPWPPTPIKLDIVQLQAAVFGPDHEPKFEDLAEGGASEGYKWVDIVRADGSKISGDSPLSLDAGKVINVILGEARSDADTLRAAEPFKIEPGGFLVARELAGFTNNEGEYETRWFWEIHGAPPDEACCFPDGTCEMLQTFACLMQGGTPMGPGSQCDMLKCPVSVEPGACCYGEADPIQCEVMDVIKCRDEYKGTWHGPGSDCEDLNGNHVADVCEIISTPEQACCFDGECRMMPVEACREEKGEPQGPGSICVGDWDGDGKDETCESKWLQPPDLSRTGIDVRDMQPIALADDFLCTETNAITRIVIWGSWLHDEYPFDPANINVTLKLREDIPDPDGSGPLYSMPGKVLWSRSYRPYEFRVEAYRKDILEGWWDPSRADSYIFPGDTVCWMYTFDVPVTEAFCQQGSPDKPIVYWLDAQATIPDYPGTRVDFGWKTSTKHWNDDAVWQYRTGGLETPFRELRYPKPHPWAGHSVDLAFALQTEPCVGACCRPGGCHLITEADCLMSFPAWWMGPGTNCDDLDGNGVADICEPVVPQACCFRDGSCAMLSPGDCLAARGTPMGVGTTCTPNPCDPLGACCHGIACTVETEVLCYSHPYRTEWMGPGTDCSDLDGDGVADACETPFIQACCFPDGSCSMLSPWDCEAARGTPMGTGTDCATIECPVYLGACCYGTHCAITTQASCVAAEPRMWAGPGTDCDDLDGDGIADVCETIVYQACCERDGTCSMRTYDECRELGGQPQGPGSACVGDWDGDRRDETCEAKWIQPPDLARTGIDVNTSLPLMLADDYLCTEKNAITRIYVWGSWYRDQYPEDPGNVYFTLAFHEDVPDPDGDGPGYSMPGRLLWRREFRPHDFHVVPFQEHIEEGFWRNPGQAGTYVFPGDTVCWLYIFDIPATEAFCQQGTPDRPLVYWLSVQATPGPTTVPSREPFFGWKTSTKHWNDNAVHRYDDSTMVSIWKELVYPEGHPWEKKSIDLAFALDAEPCVWTPSEPEEK